MKLGWDILIKPRHDNKETRENLNVWEFGLYLVNFLKNPNQTGLLIEKALFYSTTPTHPKPFRCLIKS